LSIGILILFGIWDLDIWILDHHPPFIESIIICQNQSQNFRDNALYSPAG